MAWKKHLGSLGQHETLGGALKLGGREGHLEAEDGEFLAWELPRMTFLLVMSVSCSQSWYEVGGQEP